MPCYTIQKAQVKFTAENIEILKAGLEKLGYKVVMHSTGKKFTAAHPSTRRTFDYDGEKFTGYYIEGLDTNEIKRSYSQVVVEQTAKKFGWTLKKNAAKENSYVANKRF